MPSPFFCTTKLAVDPQLFPGTRPVPAWWWGYGPVSHVSQRCFHQKNPASALCTELPPRVALSNSLPLKLIQFISGATGIAIRWNNQKINKKYQMKIEWIEGWKRDMVSVFLWVGVDVWKPEVDNESCVFLDYFPTYFLKQDLLLNLDFLDSTKLIGQWAILTQHWFYRSTPLFPDPLCVLGISAQGAKEPSPIAWVLSIQSQSSLEKLQPYSLLSSGNIKSQTRLRINLCLLFAWT